MALITTRLEDNVGTICFNNDARRNALCKAFIDEIIAAIDALHERNARVLVLRAQPGAKVWSAGHDVKELPLPGRDPLAYNDPLVTVLRAIQELPLPVIAMIEGGVWGGACDLALTCDILIGCPTSTFCMTPAKIGVPYNASGILHFINIMGINIVNEMFFTAHPMSAERAERWGILNHMVPTEQLEEFTYRMAGQISKNSPLSISVIKEQIRILANAFPLNPMTFERIQGLRNVVYDSGDYEEGIRAFMDKRKPVFNGK